MQWEDEVATSQVGVLTLASAGFSKCWPVRSIVTWPQCLGAGAAHEADCAAAGGGAANRAADGDAGAVAAEGDLHAAALAAAGPGH